MIAWLLLLQAPVLTVRVPLTLPPMADSAVVALTVLPGGIMTTTARPGTVRLDFTLPRPADGTTVTAQACGVAYRGTVAGPRSCNAVQTYTLAPPLIAGFTTAQVTALLDTARVTGYLTALGSATCHAVIRDYVTGTLLIPETRACDSVVVRLGWYALMDSTGRGTAPGVSLATWNAGQVTRGRSQRAGVRTRWLADTVPDWHGPTHYVIADPGREALAPVWPARDSTAVLVQRWR